MSMIMASYKVLYLLFIACHVCLQSEAARDPPTNTTASQGKGAIASGTIVAVVVPISVAVLILIVGICCWIKRLRKKYDSDSEGESTRGIRNGLSLQYDFITIEAATNNFSADNKLGRGGFGEVYKGMLPNGQEIAVKRLSTRSRQGVEVFKNEVEVLAKLKHQNLVSLLGFCVQGQEKILVLEYIPNKSLDNILFDLEKQKQLDWTKCYKLIKGIARGIHYLHEDSRLRIIHRDLKANNILLDSDMNPKISDFGLAIIFTVDQTQGNTHRIFGTYGYMSPEYAFYGKFSIKSDVYSFGVLLMEIISGNRNQSRQNYDDPLMSRAWRLWKDGKPLELLNPSIRESCNPNEAMRCIHISLLCIQEDPALRPSMSSILLMLESYSLTLPTPSQPAFFLKWSEELEEEDKLPTTSSDRCCAATDISSVDSLQYDFSTIEGATNKFSEGNKLGGGGFGVVYKGTLESGEEIAVKRLFRGYGQGVQEFKNEVEVVAKLQHRNLVRLLGFCVQGEEKILVYEYVPNKSLDYILFDSEKKRQLDWMKRYKIVTGIARGIKYLHDDSRLKIIHRDLKASNVLLDIDMNPKISDLDMARIFMVNQSPENTSQIFGTYGYMSPEYAMYGVFSVKSDVYSFGVLLMEIISGKSYRSFYQMEGAENLISYAWKLWKDGEPLKLLDPTIRESYTPKQAMRWVHIGLLCVQKDPRNRPSMESIVLMLDSYSVTLPTPSQPACFLQSETDPNMLEDFPFGQPTTMSTSMSVNDMSDSEVMPR